MVVRDLIRKANRFKREARWEEAASLYREIIGVNPYFAWAYSALGEVLAGQDNLDAAEVELRRAIALSSNSAWHYYQLGRVLVSGGRDDEAIACFQKAIEIRPDLDRLQRSIDLVIANKIKDTASVAGDDLYCFVCGSHELSKFSSEYDRDNEIADIFLCGHCQALIPRYSQGQLLVSLEQQVLEAEEDVGPFSEENAEELVVGYGGVADFYRNWLGEPNDEYICEVGCGRGSLLEALKRTGYRVIGCEPCPNLASKARAIYGLSDEELVNCDVAALFELVEREGIVIKGVFMWHVLEHLSNPLEVLRLICQHLVADGFVIFQIPLLTKDYLHPSHLVFYNEPCIRYLAAQVNCRVEELNYDYDRMYCGFVLRKFA